MSVGMLDERIVRQICEILSQHLNVSEAVLFGSRSKGTAKPGSDIDLAVYGIQDAIQAQTIADDLDELPTPYQFDVVAGDTIKTASLREHIKRVGIKIYP